MRITLLAFIDPAQPAPGASGRLVAARLLVENLADAAVTVPLAASITVVGDEDQAFQAHPGPITGCLELPSSPALAGRVTQSGCVGFVVPTTATLFQVALALPDGSDPITWRLR